MLTLRIPLNERFAFSHENAARLANSLSRFDSSIMIHDQNRTISAKSLLGILSLGYLQSGSLEFIIEGIDEENVLAAIKEYFHL
ncbi:MAG: HPr family phosphocarrier protein [Clostridia bacterium]|nr:HPr family phosphocarrier protein [Clostridia bacterium]